MCHPIAIRPPSAERTRRAERVHADCTRVFARASEASGGNMPLPSISALRVLSNQRRASAKCKMDAAVRRMSMTRALVPISYTSTGDDSDFADSSEDSSNKVLAF